MADRGQNPSSGGHTGHAQNMIMTTFPTHEVPKVQENQKIDETAFNRHCSCFYSYGTMV